MRAIRWFFTWFDGHPRTRTLCVLVFIALPALLLTVGQFNESLGAWLKQHSLATWGLGAAPIFTGLLGVVQQSIVERRLTPSELFTLLNSLAQVVGSKLERFASVLPMTPRTRAKIVFQKITQPDHQIDEIVQAVYGFFVVTKPMNFSVEELKIRVVLAEMGPNHISAWGPFYPNDTRPRSALSSLQDERCGFSRAKAGRRIVVVEDFMKESIQAAGACFHVSHDSRRMEEGSLLCYPIHVRKTDEVPYVLSVSVSKKGYFQKADAAVYARIIEPFEQRIVLEYFLKQIKQSVV